VCEIADAKGNKSDCIKIKKMEKRIFELTVSEFTDLLKEQFQAPMQAEAPTEKKYLYSIRELANFLQCSTVTAQHLKNKGLIPFRQLGRKLIFDQDAVLNAMHTNKRIAR